MSDHDAGEDVLDKPAIGLKFDTEEVAYKYYNEYGRRSGFSVRREYGNWRKDTDNNKKYLTSRMFVCNKYGFRKVDKRDIHTVTPRAETRTGCNARMGVRYVDNEGQYECYHFTEEHNHPLHTPATVHFMRSQRNVSIVHASHIDLADDSGIRPKSTYELMGRQAGGGHNLGYTRVDIWNYLRTKRQRDLAYGEAGSVLKYFQQQTCMNPSFTHSIQMDSEDRITNIFWADHKMRIDYSIFGDVVTFDTTFGTNKENRPFGVFSGFNHHRGGVIFGAALLYDETAESFKWLFEAFLEAHDHKMPRTIFTDQDAAMAKAIPQVLTSTRHGLCSWHLLQNGIKHLGHLMKDGSNFLREFTACMFEYEEESEFEMAWEQLVKKYESSDDSWLHRTYQVKEKWAKCFMKQTLTLGIRSTQLSESINRDLKDYLSAKLDVVQFFKHFDRVLKDKRENELKAEFDARNKLVRNLFPDNSIMKQAAKIYTPTIFDTFHAEYLKISACYIKQRRESHDFREYVIGMENGDRDYKVLYKPSETSICCSCMKFESFGILCCHALKILENIEDQKFIPDAYILERWTRKARHGTLKDSQGNQIEDDLHLDYTQRYQTLCLILVKLATKASNSAVGYSLLRNAAKELDKQLDDLGIQDGVETLGCEQTSVINAKGLKKKEERRSGKRHKSCLKKRRKAKKTCGVSEPLQTDPSQSPQ